MDAEPTYQLSKTGVQFKKDGMYISQSDLLILISYMQQDTLTLECRKKLQQLLKVVVETNQHKKREHAQMIMLPIKPYMRLFFYSKNVPQFEQNFADDFETLPHVEHVNLVLTVTGC